MQQGLSATDDVGGCWVLGRGELRKRSGVSGSVVGGWGSTEEGALRRLRQAAPAEPAKHRDEPESPSPGVEGRLSEVRPLAHDDDESPSREDRGYGHNAFDIPVPLPRFLRRGKSRGRRGQ